VRLLSATHKDLQAEVKVGRFRQDLYYRLNVIQVTLPALRDRLEDLPELSARILDRIAHETGMAVPATLSATAMKALMQYPFPGNVRELENLLQRAVALSNHTTLEAEDLGISRASDAEEPEVEIDFEPTQAAGLSEPVDVIPVPTTPAPLPSDLAGHLDLIERDILVRALEKHRYNRTAAGASMGLSLRQMRYRMARLGVQITDQGVVLGERFDPDVD
jgi:two-component system response regulator PilR (NtrC family)